MNSGSQSNFSQTCRLLSQYLKENGSFGELNLDLTSRSSESKGMMETVNFLPLIEKSDQNSCSRNYGIDVNILPKLFAGGEETLNKSGSCTKTGIETGQMTIFYAGQVIVFDDFPADRAKEIMMLASKSTAANTADKPADSPSRSPSIVGIMEQRPPHIPPPTLALDLPIARKKSLARFLERRKDRVTLNSPYQTAAAKPVKTEPWLGFVPQLPLQRQ